MQRFYLAILSVAVLAACGDSGQPLAPSTEAPTAPLVSATTTITNERVPFSTVEFVSCANGGAGEEVVFEGTLHTLTRTTETSSGNFSITIHENPQGVKGTGQITGDTYQLSGSFNESHTVAAGETGSLHLRFLVTGPGTDNNFHLRVSGHYTVNANGEVTVDFFDISAECS